MSRNSSLVLYVIVLFFSLNYNLAAQIHINEFLASNNSNIADESGEFEDWIEIYNEGSNDLDLSTYFISDNLTDLTLWQIPAGNPGLTTVPAGGFLILWADKDVADGANHLDIKLGASGEDIVLVAPDGQTIIDQYTFNVQVEDVSFGRTEDGGSEWDFFAQPTPGATNDTPAGTPQVFSPVASLTGGIYSQNISVSFSTSTNGASIYYTLDGSHPTPSDNEYSGPIFIDENTPVRAKAYLNPLIPSTIQTETYLFNVDHKLPVIAYTADPDEMFDSNSGMYPNYEEDIEINVNVELYELDGSQGFNQMLESEISGGGSPDQKSLALKAKSSLGSATIDHQIFPLSNRDKYRSLILRSSGQDWNKSFFRDAVSTSLAWDVSDVNETQQTIQDPKIHGQAYRPCVTYINGEYWGIYNIRERTDKRYIKVHFGLDDNEIDFIENHGEVKEGDFIAFEELEDFLKDNNLSSDNNFQYVKDRVDLDEYMDYIALNIYVDNSDWPGHNHRQFRERVAESKWRFLIYDLDYTFGLRVEGQSWNSGYNNANSLDRLLSENNSWPNPEKATLLFRRLMENEGWRSKFINRMADQLNLLFDDDRVISRIDDFVAEREPEIQEHIDQWLDGYNRWDENVQILRDYATGRADNVRNHFISEINEIDGISDVSINLSNASEGEVALSTISVHSGNAPFSGTYFEGVDIPIQAFPNRGNVFESWSGDLSSNDPNESININSNTSITANFSSGSNANETIVINEINYNSPDNSSSDDWVELYNPNSSAVNISGWYFEDESGQFFGIPANTILAADDYLVLVETTTKFSTIYPQVNNFIGDFGIPIRGFGLSNKGELITLKNAGGQLIDQVEFDDKAPWPVEADGTGPTLQLINPELDNAQASSWEAIPATPGEINANYDGQNQGPGDQSINFPTISDQLNTNPPFQVNASATSGLPVTFIILSGPASVSGNTITLSGATGVVTVQASQDGNANWNSAPNVNRSFEVTNDSPPPTGEYCESKSEAPWHEWIAGVQLNNLNNSSRKDDYIDYTNLSTNLEQGNNYTITLTAGYSYTTYDEYFCVWIDYNQNEVFDIPDELAFTGIVSGIPTGTDSGSVSGTISVPNNGMLGTTRMRVSMQRGSYPPPCGTFPEGEVEDYSVNIIQGNGSSISLSCPSDISIISDPGQAGAVASWNAPNASTSCPSGALTLVQDGGAASGSFFPIGTQAISYAASDACGNTESCSFNVTILPNNTGGGDPCESSSDFPWHDWISNVQINTINNPSSKSRYSDFTNISTTLKPAESYELTLITGYSWRTFEEHWKVWIDYNQNGEFEEPTEIAFSGILPPPPNGTDNATIQGEISIPSNAVLGLTVMRVAMKREAEPGPCETFPFGEVEDYTVNIDNQANPDYPQAFTTNKTDIRLYPNPVESELTVEMKKTNLDFIEIFNISGQKIHHEIGIEEKELYRFNVDSWQRGMYFIHFKFKKGKSISKRFIVEGDGFW